MNCQDVWARRRSRNADGDVGSGGTRRFGPLVSAQRAFDNQLLGRNSLIQLILFFLSPLILLFLFVLSGKVRWQCLYNDTLFSSTLPPPPPIPSILFHPCNVGLSAWLCWFPLSSSPQASRYLTSYLPPLRAFYGNHFIISFLPNHVEAPLRLPWNHRRTF